MPKGEIPKVPASVYRHEIRQLIKFRKKVHRVVEVGVYCADLSRLIEPLLRIRKLYLVDTWDNKHFNCSKEHIENIYKSVYYWAKTSKKVKILRMPSVKAAKQFRNRSIDLLHLDADHSYHNVMADIKAWKLKVKKGHLMTGDNYEIEEVKQAVQDNFGNHIKKLAKGRIWIAKC